jgi:hypothetical protein
MGEGNLIGFLLKVMNDISSSFEAYLLLNILL